MAATATDLVIVPSNPSHQLVQPTAPSVNNKPYYLNMNKQTDKTLSNLSTFSPFDISNFKSTIISKDNASFLLSNQNSAIILQFTNILAELSNHPTPLSLCGNHSTPDRSLYIKLVAKKHLDKAGALDTMSVEVKCLANIKYVKLATLKVHNTAKSIQLQGKPENIEQCLHQVIAPLMDITRASPSGISLNVPCLVCHRNQLPAPAAPSKPVLPQPPSTPTISVSYPGGMLQKVWNYTLDSFTPKTLNLSSNQAAILPLVLPPIQTIVPSTVESSCNHVTPPSPDITSNIILPITSQPESSPRPSLNLPKPDTHTTHVQSPAIGPATFVSPSTVAGNLKVTPHRPISRRFTTPKSSLRKKMQKPKSKSAQSPSCIDKTQYTELIDKVMCRLDILESDLIEVKSQNTTLKNQVKSLEQRIANTVVNSSTQIVEAAVRPKHSHRAGRGRHHNRRSNSLTDDPHTPTSHLNESAGRENLNIPNAPFASPMIHQHQRPPPYNPQVTNTQNIPHLMETAPQPPRKPLLFHGDSNLQRCSSALRNAVGNQAEIKPISGACFDTIRRDIVDSGPCDVRVISGGTNDAHSGAPIHMVKREFCNLLGSAMESSRVVIVSAPPPIPSNNNRTKVITDMMSSECARAGVEFIHPYFPNLNVRMFQDSKHMTKRGCGYYCLSILRHLSTEHPYIKINGPLCSHCHNIGHRAVACDKYSTR